MSAKAVIRMPGEGKEVTLAGKPLVFLVTGQDTKHTSMFDWTLPAGFLENGETSTDGAIRETREEACANVSIEGLYAVFNLPHISQIYMFFRASLLDLDFKPGFESTDVRLFQEHEIPWDELAFPVVRDTLQHYFSDRSSGVYPVRVGDIIYDRRKP